MKGVCHHTTALVCVCGCVVAVGLCHLLYLTRMSNEEFHVRTFTFGLREGEHREDVFK